MSALPRVLMLALLAAGCGSTTPPVELPAIDPSLTPTPASSVAELTELTEAGTHSVDAYVVSVPNCPPCEGPEPCEPCGAASLNLILSDDGPSTAPIPSGHYVDPAGLSTSAFMRGQRYRFVIAVELLEGQPPYLRLLGAEPAD